MQIKKSFTASLNYLHSMLAMVEDFLQHTAFSAPNREQSYFLRLLLEEVFVNIIQHAYSQKKERREEEKIEILCSREKKEEKGSLLVIQVKDWGKPFNPLTYSKKEKECEGWGILLIRKIADHLSYSRREGANLLLMHLSMQ